MAKILETANGGTKKTRIMYKANLCYSQLKMYLSDLVANELLEYVPGEQIYKTTDKGMRFLNTVNQMGLLVGPIMAVGTR